MGGGYLGFFCFFLHVCHFFLTGSWGKNINYIQQIAKAIFCQRLMRRGLVQPCCACPLGESQADQALLIGPLFYAPLCNLSAILSLPCLLYYLSQDVTSLLLSLQPCQISGMGCRGMSTESHPRFVWTRPYYNHYREGCTPQGILKLGS